MHPIKYYLWLLSSLTVTPVCAQKTGKSSFLVFYGKTNAINIKGYNTLIIESNHYVKKDISILKQNNKDVYAYISVGEVNKNASLYKEFKNITLEKNNIWNSFYLNWAEAQTEIILLKEIDKMVKKGISGLFLDNIDNFSSYGKQFYAQQSLVSFLIKLKTIYPSLKIIQNSGYELINKTYSLIDGILFESVVTKYDFEKKLYQLRNLEEMSLYKSKIQSIFNNYKIPIFVLEYAITKELKKEIALQLNELPVVYASSGIDLQSFPKN